MSPDVHTGFLGPSSRLGASGHLLLTPSSTLSAPLRAVWGWASEIVFQTATPRVELATPLPAHDLEVVSAGVAMWELPCPGGPGPAPRPRSGRTRGSSSCSYCTRAGSLSFPLPLLWSTRPPGSLGSCLLEVVRASGPGGRWTSLG